LDDDAIDYPFAYKSFALLMRSLKLDDEADTMGDKITVEGNPRITPKDQLKKAFTQLDG
jgi:translation initiation factor 4G